MFEMLSRSKLKGFTLINMAGHYDMTKKKEYSNFINNMKTIKQLPIPTDIKWGTKIVQL